MWYTLLCGHGCQYMSGSGATCGIACNIPANNCDDLFLYSDCDIDQRLSDRVHGLPGVSDIGSRFILMSSV